MYLCAVYYTPMIDLFNLLPLMDLDILKLNRSIHANRNTDILWSL